MGVLKGEADVVRKRARGDHLKIEVCGISFDYGSIRALDQVTLGIEEGEIVGIIGPNASGKTTLLRCISGRLKPEGTVLLEGRNIIEMTRREIARCLGMVPQHTDRMFPFTVLEVVLMGRNPYIDRLGIELPGDLGAVQEAMELTDTLRFAERRMDELSGGEVQRVIIARAMAQEPEILLLDEPTHHLDINHKIEMLELIRGLGERRGMAVLMVSHDLDLAGRYCDRIILMREGRIFAAGRPEEVLTPSRISAVYGIDVDVIRHPGTGFLIVVPKPAKKPTPAFRDRRHRPENVICEKDDDSSPEAGAGVKH